MSDPPDLRVSDQDRESAAQEIREHFAAGRLSEDELDARVQAAFRAQTRSELGALSEDLPRLALTPAQGRTQLAERRRELRGQLLQEAGGGAIVFGACTAMWIASGASGMFWPIWIALAIMLPLLRTSWRLYGPAPDLERVEADLANFRRRRDRDARRAARRRF
ncbi:MAG TPA: DUF1707 domain-containing protein [Solirubrobacteraceae bacterium]|jgi:hypothetical protein|nr:DUF1707 domain-containing protein [Solirubrobacteraceae bacterium]